MQILWCGKYRKMRKICKKMIIGSLKSHADSVYILWKRSAPCSYFCVPNPQKNVSTGYILYPYGRLPIIISKEEIMKTQTKIMIQDTISGNGQRWDRKKNAALTDCALNKGDTRLLMAVKIPPNGTTGIQCRGNGRSYICRHRMRG